MFFSFERRFGRDRHSNHLNARMAGDDIVKRCFARSGADTYEFK